MAAGSHVDRSHADRIGFVLDNVLGTANLLEWARKNHPATKLLYFGTDEQLGPRQMAWSSMNNSRFEPENMYAATKAGGELYASPSASTLHAHAVTRCCNVFGPAQDAENSSRLPSVASSAASYFRSTRVGGASRAAVHSGR